MKCRKLLADYYPFQKKLLKLEEVRISSPDLRNKAIKLLRSATYEVDNVTRLVKFLQSS